ncbi:MAG: hypothetical protein HWN80_01790 [Candidatus Lokiarchaeota archaeon]|nr:hypothetical protein [Candidatus Lokiarchaeota archaeon]
MTSENDTKENLQTYLKKEFLKDAKRIKKKFPPISEKINGISKSLKIKNIYELKGSLNNFILITTKNYAKNPRYRYFLAILLASQSSDLLVNLAKEFSKKNRLKLIQFSLYPQHFRVGLFSLNEIHGTNNISEAVNLLKEFRIIYRKDLEKLGKLIERV